MNGRFCIFQHSLFVLWIKFALLLFSVNKQINNDWAMKISVVQKVKDAFTFFRSKIMKYTKVNLICSERCTTFKFLKLFCSPGFHEMHRIKCWESVFYSQSTPLPLLGPTVSAESSSFELVQRSFITNDDCFQMTSIKYIKVFMMLERTLVLLPWIFEHKYTHIFTTVLAKWMKESESAV